MLLHGLGFRPEVAEQVDGLSINEAQLEASLGCCQKHPESKSDDKKGTEPSIDPYFGKATQRDKTLCSRTDHTDDSPWEHSEVALVREGLGRYELEYLFDDASDTAPIPDDGLAEKTDSALHRQRKQPRFTLGGPSPYPDWAVPSEADCVRVYDLLTSKHGHVSMPADIPPPSQNVAGCGEVSFILDALIRTLISTHTHMRNADKAIEQLCKTYRTFESGGYLGSIDWEEVRFRGPSTLEKAIRPAGKSVKTSEAIATILEKVKEENDVIRKLIRIRRPIIMYKKGQLKRREILTRSSLWRLEEDPNFLTLDYLHLAPPKKIFERLQTFSGVGVKTAACLLLFCIQYPTLAVDTHVWRLSKLLGWVPPTASRDNTYFHVDRFVPNRLKYSLHQLFIQHGKYCHCCSGRSKGYETASDDKLCILGNLVDPIRAKKNSTIPKTVSTMSNNIQNSQADVHVKMGFHSAGEYVEAPETSHKKQSFEVSEGQVQSKKRNFTAVEAKVDADNDLASNVKKEKLSDEHDGPTPEEIQDSSGVVKQEDPLKVKGEATDVDAINPFLAPVASTPASTAKTNNPDSAFDNQAPSGIQQALPAQAQRKKTKVEAAEEQALRKNDPNSRYLPGNRVLSDHFTMSNPRRSQRTKNSEKNVSYVYDDSESEDDAETPVSGASANGTSANGVSVAITKKEEADSNEPIIKKEESGSDLPIKKEEEANSNESIVKEEEADANESIIKEEAGPDMPTMKEEEADSNGAIVKMEEDNDSDLFITG